MPLPLAPPHRPGPDRRSPPGRPPRHARLNRPPGRVGASGPFPGGPWRCRPGCASEGPPSPPAREGVQAAGGRGGRRAPPAVRDDRGHRRTGRRGRARAGPHHPFPGQTLPHKLQFRNTTVGGLSGLDRDPRTGTWYFLSDDRWRYQPPRFYTGTLDIDRKTGKFSGVKLTGVASLRRPDGSGYPEYGKAGSPDPEAIRFDRFTGRLLWSSEGDRPGGTTTVPVFPLSVRWMDKKGTETGELRVPGNLTMTDTDTGPRRNFGFEGLTFSPHGIAAMVEGPLHQDGEPVTAEHGAPARITLWSRGGTPRGQYVYPLDPLPAAPEPPDGQSDAGVSEILAIDDHRYLALERSWREGAGYAVKPYEVDLRRATNVLCRDSLATGRRQGLLTCPRATPQRRRRAARGRAAAGRPAGDAAAFPGRRSA
ncbi:esterase-like activity of phytase family protein [Spongiactinospora gelatinilytica]|uniref:esterase-like activity of phytase family protein n=1 Tax=Spongiactinospora gelatinilytica TaxID=2666298 RepID=UPI0018F52557|nr:esterase-like activity of phytase family protein [Spongiactinospora gelatinilytica]